MVMALPAHGIQRLSGLPLSADISQRPSPNCGPRRGGARPDIIVLHYTAMKSAEAAIARLCDPEAEVSAHYVICARGEITQLVQEDARAWHAGAGAWGDVRDVNSRSIGIELANLGNVPFAAAQMDALEGLLAGIMARWAIPASRVIGHSDMAPGRKFDPGARFDWARLVRAGLAVGAGDVLPTGKIAGKIAGQGADRDMMLRALAAFGYDVEVPFEALLGAFRLRFRQGFDGPYDGIDLALAQDLAARFAVDQPAPSA
ncbi:MAG: N-acetylmuramoyl-L-alanine amidase [Paracoccaceae bacterium]